MKRIIATLALLAASAAWAAFPMDDFPGSATPMTGASGAMNGNSATATAQAGEPLSAKVHTVWWAWKAPKSYSVFFSTKGSKFDTVLGAYTGSSVSALTEVDYNDDVSAGSDSTSRIRFYANAGTTYYICVAGRGSSSCGDIILTWGSVFSDSFPGRGRHPETYSYGSVSGSNEDASLQSGEPMETYGYRSVWMPWKAEMDGLVYFSTSGSSFDTMLGAYTGTSLEDDLAEVAVNDDYGGSTQSRIAFDAVRGTTYWICVVSTYDVAGDIELSWQQGRGYMDDFPGSGGMEPKGGFRGSIALNSNADATLQPGEPLAKYGYRSVWTVWKAPDSARVTFSTMGTGFDTVMGAYTGSTLAGLEEVAFCADNYDSSPSYSEFTIDAVKGTTYYICVAAVSPSATGYVALSWEPMSSSTDDFPGVSGTSLTGASGTVFGDPYGSTIQSGEPIVAHNPSYVHSVWWAWKAPANGYVWFTGGETMCALGAYTGSGLSSLSEVAFNQDAYTYASDGEISTIAFTATKGTVYYICAADDYSSMSVGDYLTLKWRMSPFFDVHPGSDSPPQTSASGSLAGSNVDGHWGSVVLPWKAPSSGKVTFSTAGSTADVEPMACLPFYDGWWVTLETDSDRHITFDAVAGTVYWIYVTSHVQDAIGNFTLTWKPGAGPEPTLTIGGGKTSMSRAYSCEAKPGESFSVACSGSWTATASASWITIISGSSGSGNGTVKYKLSENTGTSKREGTIKVKSGGITRTCAITQDKPLLIAGKTSLSRSYEAAKQTDCFFSVTCSQSPWTAVSSASWVTLHSDSKSGTGSGKIYYDVAANTFSSQRTATIKVTSRSLTRTCAITQKAGAEPTLTIGGGKTSMSRQYSCEAKAGESFSVACNGSWTATASASWITITTGASGSGNGTIKYKLSENTGTSKREGTIKVKCGSITRTCTITQDKPLLIGGKTSLTRTYEAAKQTGCYFSVTCSQSPWTAVSSASWVTLTSDSKSGTGSGKVTYSVAANTSTSDRTATIKVTSRSLTRTCTITQKGK